MGFFCDHTKSAVISFAGLKALGEAEQQPTKSTLLPALYPPSSKAMTEQAKGTRTYNIDSGTGTSVLQLIKAFEEKNGIHIP